MWHSPYTLEEIACMETWRQEHHLGRYDFLVRREPPYVLLPDSWERAERYRTANNMEAAREAILHGPWPGDGSLPFKAATVSRLTYEGLLTYKPDWEPDSDQLYALEFQGARTQYIKFGRTASLQRRLREHLHDARTHSFALLNGWVSPGVTDAKAAESELLAYARRFKHTHAVGERFYGMPFEIAQDLTRAVYSEWEFPDQPIT